jgi:hypothetical protein
MDAKLTLKLNKQTIDRAKKYAVDQNRSLSRIIEDYLTALTLSEHKNLNDNEIVISPFVRSISSGNSIPSDLDYKTLYSKYLIEKYR